MDWRMGGWIDSGNCPATMGSSCRFGRGRLVYIFPFPRTIFNAPSRQNETFNNPSSCREASAIDHSANHCHSWKSFSNFQPQIHRCFPYKFLGSLKRRSRCTNYVPRDANSGFEKPCEENQVWRTCWCICCRLGHGLFHWNQAYSRLVPSEFQGKWGCKWWVE